MNETYNFFPSSNISSVMDKSITQNLSIDYREMEHRFWVLQFRRELFVNSNKTARTKVEVQDSEKHGE